MNKVKKTCIPTLIRVPPLSITSAGKAGHTIVNRRRYGHYGHYGHHEAGGRLFQAFAQLAHGLGG